MIAWAVRGEQELGSIKLLPEDWSNFARWFLVLGYSVCISLIVFMLRNLKKLEPYLKKTVDKALNLNQNSEDLNYWVKHRLELAFFVSLVLFLVCGPVFILTYEGTFIGSLISTLYGAIIVGISLFIAFFLAFISQGLYSLILGGNDIFTKNALMVIGFFFGTYSVMLTITLATSIGGAIALVASVTLTASIAIVITLTLALIIAVSASEEFYVSRAFVLKFAGSITFIGVIAEALCIPFLVNGLQEVFKPENISIIIFLFILPLLNGLFDYLSLGLSRFLGNTLLKNRTKYNALGLAFVDLLCALALLVGLVFFFHFPLKA